MIRLARLAIIFLAILCVCTECLAQFHDTRRIGGKVYYAQTGDVAKHVIVELHTEQGSVISPTVTGDDGDFLFTDLQPGVYTVAVSLQDYEPASQTVDTSFNSIQGMSVSLVPRGKPGSGTATGKGPISSHILTMPQNAQAAYDEGRQKLLGEKKPEESVKLFEKAVADAPSFYEAWEQLCMAQLTLGHTAEGEKAARKSIETSDDKYAPADFDEGSLLMDRQQFGEGEKFVRHGLELTPDSWLGHYELGRALFYQGHVKDALESAEKSKTLNPKNPNIYRLLANIHMRQRNSGALREDLGEYIKLDPDSPAGQRAQQMLASLPKAQNQVR
jgi:tetratricopeptide (TPR) repeat protein